MSNDTWSLTLKKKTEKRRRKRHKERERDRDRYGEGMREKDRKYIHWYGASGKVKMYW